MAVPMAEPLIRLRGITRSFAAGPELVTVLRDIDLDIHAGEFVAIMGASGSGKSTLMNVLGCLDQPSGGSYLFHGRDVGALDPDARARLRRAHFGFIFQRYHLLGDLDAVGNVEVPAIYAGQSRDSRRARARALLTRLGLEQRLDHRPSELSGGQQQRVSVARALMNGGEVILADEPTGALDSRSGAEMIALLLELHAQGHTIVMVTHDPALAAHASRVIEISDGRITADSGSPAGAAPGAIPAPHGRAGVAAGLNRAVEAFHMALLAMTAHRMRSFLTMLGIIIGIASVVLVVALGTGSQERVLQNISSLGTSTITVRAGSGFGSRDTGRIRTLMPSDAGAIALEPFAAGVSPAVSANATVRRGATSASAQISGVSADFFAQRSYNLVAGSLFDAGDIASLAQVAVIDEDTRATFFASDGEAVGNVLHLGKVPVRVIGVVRASGASFGPSSLNVWLPYTTVMSRLSGQRHLDSIGVQVAEGRDMAAAQQAISDLLLARHGVQDFFLQNSDTIRQALTSTTRTMTVLIAAIAVISLVVGGIGVMNIMLVSVTERTREIGIRMATGARMKNILQQFLIEALVVSALGGVIGVALGLASAALIERFGTAVQYSLAPVVLAFSCAFLTGLVFGYLPARKAARLDPVAALASE